MGHVSIVSGILKLIYYYTYPRTESNSIHRNLQPSYVVLRRWRQSVVENTVSFSWYLKRVALL